MIEGGRRSHSGKNGLTFGAGFGQEYVAGRCSRLALALFVAAVAVCLGRASFLGQLQPAEFELNPFRLSR